MRAHSFIIPQSYTGEIVPNVYAYTVTVTKFMLIAMCCLKTENVVIKSGLDPLFCLQWQIIRIKKYLPD